MTEPEWWKTAVVYQVYPRSFADSDGDGIGDLRGVRQKLDHLVDLGIDVVWLSPIYASPHDDNGYDISDYQAIDPLFGTLEDFDELVAELHRRGLKLMMDLVVNHTSDEHPWFVESASSRDSAKRDWYWWRDPKPDGAAPNNWGSFFSGPVWELDERTGQYYLHLFSKKQPDLNWENPEVRAAVYEMMRWWLDRGVDGFRMDVINFISKDPALPDGVQDPVSGLGDGFPHFGSGPRIHEFLQEMHREVFENRDAALVTVGEMPGVTTEQARLYTDPARREVDMVFQFEHVGLDHGPGGKFTRRALDLAELKHSFARWQEALADVGWNSLYWNNHDQPRVVSRFGNDREHWYESATALATLLHLMRGTPYVYQGEELGMTNAPFSAVDDLRDIESLNYYNATVAVDEETPIDVLARVAVGSRDNARTPVQWDDSPGAGFTDGRPWIAVNPNASWLNARAQEGDDRSVLAWYRRLIALRHEEPLLRDGRFELLLPSDPRLWVYTRTAERRQLLVAGNCSDGPVTVPEDLLGEWADAAVVLANAPGRERLTASLGPWEVAVLERSVPVT
ncbi:alpha-glucosidase [Naasia sp. SYSU D00057]|uniref:alpha-glucosidase n=1 Tax=Naasia sp. SYSU D00057 TaxID=2817380 RepID=UPI001B312B95|nr:alpha-glucosidase [Naasia sp. SYSU D00057]